jgi:caffeoyl-CoA O-methyltransferase
MYYQIPEPVKQRMELLEAMDREDQTNGTPRLSRLRQITPDTGRLLALLLASAPAGMAVEIGTSAGYSALWMSLACKENGRKLFTFELMEEKIAKAKITFREAGVEEYVELVEGDALANLDHYPELAFLFCDTEKTLYLPIYEKVVERIVPGGLFVADNCKSHKEVLGGFLERIMNDPRMDPLLLPIGTGVLVARKTGRTRP